MLYETTRDVEIISECFIQKTIMEDLVLKESRYVLQCEVFLVPTNISYYD